LWLILFSVISFTDVSIYILICILEGIILTVSNVAAVRVFKGCIMELFRIGMK